MTSVNPWLFVASLAALAACVTHLLLGGRAFARPLLGSDLRSPVKHTHYYCWHLVTAALALMAVAFAWAAAAPEAREAAMLGAAMAVAFLIVNVVQNIALRLSFAKHPQGGFFAIISALALMGLAHG